MKSRIVERTGKRKENHGTRNPRRNTKITQTSNECIRNVGHQRVFPFHHGDFSRNQTTENHGNLFLCGDVAIQENENVTDFQRAFFIFSPPCFFSYFLRGESWDLMEDTNFKQRGTVSNNESAYIYINCHRRLFEVFLLFIMINIHKKVTIKIKCFVNSKTQSPKIFFPVHTRTFFAYYLEKLKEAH